MATDEKELQRRLRRLERAVAREKKPARLAAIPPGRTTRKHRLAKALLVLAGILVALPPFVWPLRAPVTSGFFLRVKPDSHALRLELHHGIDIGAPLGTGVFPTALGTVERAGYSEELGNYVLLRHALGVTSVYGHLRRIEVKQGQFVLPALSKLGESGSTGRSTGPHLHFGIYYRGQALPPKLLLVFHDLRYLLLGV